jgi:hypothetical protein
MGAYDWQPNDEEQKYLKLIISMTTDCLMGKGTADRKAYVNNLKSICRLLDEVAPHERD